MIKIKTPEQINKIEKADQVIAEIYKTLDDIIVPGMTTKELDAIIEDKIVQKGGKAMLKGYTPFASFPPFPAATCISVNEVILHGIPNDRVLEEGDIVSVDTSIELDGFFGDTCHTYLVGDKVDPKRKELSENTRIAMEKGIEACQIGNYLSEIGKVIDHFLTPLGYGIVREYSGHGVGLKLHEDPAVVFYYDTHRKGPRLKEGMVITVEPMITQGSPRIKTLADQWTVVTADHSDSAQWEHSIAITKDGPRVLSEIR